MALGEEGLKSHHPGVRKPEKVAHHSVSLRSLNHAERSKSKGPNPNKIYALHEPEVDCISKGKERVRYEFGCKVGVATTLDEAFVVSIRSYPGAPYDRHTPSRALEQVTILTDQRPELVVVDRGYRSHGEETTHVLISGMRRSLMQQFIADLRRRIAIETEIGHMKIDDRLSRSPLKGTFYDAICAVLRACGRNIHKILAHLRASFA